MWPSAVMPDIVQSVLSEVAEVVSSEASDAVFVCVSVFPRGLLCSLYNFLSLKCCS
jgi:hypothetical protein